MLPGFAGGLFVTPDIIVGAVGAFEPAVGVDGAFVPALRPGAPLAPVDGVLLGDMGLDPVAVIAPEVVEPRPAWVCAIVP
jgi:hypothetical protein